MSEVLDLTVAQAAERIRSKELSASGLRGMHSGHSTPLPYLQAYWMFGARGKPDAMSETRHHELRGQARREAALLRWGFTAKPF